jgi:hypothetical protein
MKSEEQQRTRKRAAVRLRMMGRAALSDADEARSRHCLRWRLANGNSSERRFERQLSNPSASSLSPLEAQVGEG